MGDSIFPGTRFEIGAIFPTLGSFPLADVEAFADLFSDWIAEGHPEWAQSYIDAIHAAIDLFTPVLGTATELLEYLENYPYAFEGINVWAQPNEGGN